MKQRWTEEKIDALLAKKGDYTTGGVQTRQDYICLHVKEMAMLRRYIEDCRDSLKMVAK